MPASQALLDDSEKLQHFLISKSEGQNNCTVKRSLTDRHSQTEFGNERNPLILLNSGKPVNLALDNPKFFSTPPIFYKLTLILFKPHNHGTKFV
jgi:hypothetical protein